MPSFWCPYGYRINTKVLPKYSIRGAIRVKFCANAKKITQKKKMKYPPTSHKNG